jgi:hypothetical protein
MLLQDVQDPIENDSQAPAAAKPRKGGITQEPVYQTLSFKSHAQKSTKDQLQLVVSKEEAGRGVA